MTMIGVTVTREGRWKWSQVKWRWEYCGQVILTNTRSTCACVLREVKRLALIHWLFSQVFCGLCYERHFSGHSSGTWPRETGFWALALLLPALSSSSSSSSYLWWPRSSASLVVLFSWDAYCTSTSSRWPLLEESESNLLKQPALTSASDVKHTNTPYTWSTHNRVRLNTQDTFGHFFFSLLPHSCVCILLLCCECERVCVCVGGHKFNWGLTSQELSSNSTHRAR